MERRAPYFCWVRRHGEKTMIIEADLIKDVVLLIDKNYQVVDGFKVEGPTTYECEGDIAYYTYRSYLTLPGYCAVCGKPIEEIHTSCTSSGGFHAYVGAKDVAEIPDLHKAEQRSIPLVKIRFEDLDFFLEPDNLFGVDQTRQAFLV